MDIWQQAKALPMQERKELMKMLLDTFETDAPVTQSKTGADIVALLEAKEPVAL